MLPRLMQAGIAFATTVVLYQGYVLALAPFVEPPGAISTAQPISLADLQKAPPSLERYRPVLEAYFPGDHWCFRRQPIIIENSQAMIVVGEYSQNDAGELRVPQVAIVFYPTPRDPTLEPPRDAIILEPELGATLQLDQQLGQGGGLGAMGRLQVGKLLGAVVVRSDMKEPGEHDDLRIDTSDLFLNAEFIRTSAPVTMRLGAHQGRGRGLEIRFLKTAATAAAGPGSLFGKLDSLEISSEVAALVMPGERTMFGNETTGASAAAGPASSGRQANAAPEGGKFADAPARITCTGPFTIDFTGDLASFSENVVVRQMHAGGALDELRAEQVTLYFAATQEWGGDAPSGGPSAVGSVRLEPTTLEAVGTSDAPVQLSAPSQGASARGQRLWMDFLRRQVVLDHGDEVSVSYRGAELQAPILQYELPPKDSNRRLGQIAARGGAGKLVATPDPKKPGETIEVRWTQSMQMVRRGELSVLVLDGRPRVDLVGPRAGRLWADQMEVHLRETPGALDPAGQGRPLPSTIQAERIVARSNVGIQSAELNGTVNSLDLRILNPDAPAGAPAHASAGAVGRVEGAATPATPTARTSNGGPALFGQGAVGPRRSYFIKGQTLEIDAYTRDRRAEIAAIRVDGGVDFQETTPGAAGEAPLRILAEHLNVTDADTPDAKIEIRGGDATGALPAGLATIAARGTVLRAPTLAVNRGAGRAWINTPGEVQMLVTRDTSGQPLATPQLLRITWRDSMELMRDRLTFQGNVFVQHADGWLSSEQLVVVLTAPVQFDGASGGQAPEAAQLECHGNVQAEFEQRDPNGAVASRQQLRVEELIVNQITGALQGRGEGQLDSIHLSKGGGSWKDLPTPGAPPRVVEQEDHGPPQKRHLSVKFYRGFEGNIHDEAWVRVRGDVRTIYGPVDAWDQRLEMTPGGSPGPDTFWLTCDSLQVNESPLVRLQPPGPDGKRRKFGLVELKAEGNVTIEGEHPERGAFTINGHSATFDQAKTLFILKGDGVRRATITFQQFRGGPFQTQSAQEWSYNMTTGGLIIQDMDKFQLDQLN